MRDTPSLPARAGARCYPPWHHAFRASLAAAFVLMMVYTITGFAPAAAQEPADSEAPEPTVTELHPGVWNQTNWVGPEMALVGIFKVIPEVQLAYAWNAEEGFWDFAMRDGFTSDGGVKPGTHLFLWVAGTEPVEWERKPFTPPLLVFDDTVSDELRALARERVTDVIAFFAERYGLWVSRLRVEYGSTKGCVFAGPQPDGTIQLTAGAPFSHDSCFPHEYGHALHFMLAGDLVRFGWVVWMIEGVANYFGSEVWGDWRFHHEDYESYYTHEVAPVLRDHTNPWPDTVDYVGEPNRVISQRAVAHLVDTLGERVFLEALGKQPPSFSDQRFVDTDTGEFLWRRLIELGFEDVFGITYDSFLSSFEDIRRSLGDNPTISGKVSRQNNDPSIEITVKISHSQGGWPSYQLLSRNGTFALQVLGSPGTYVVHVHEHEEGVLWPHGTRVAACKIVQEGGRNFSNITIDLDEIKRLRTGSTYDLPLLAACEDL